MAWSLELITVTEIVSPGRCTGASMRSFTEPFGTVCVTPLVAVGLAAGEGLGLIVFMGEGLAVAKGRAFEPVGEYGPHPAHSATAVTIPMMSKYRIRIKATLLSLHSSPYSG
jgi:hypothetical protein